MKRNRVRCEQLYFINHDTKRKDIMHISELDDWDQSKERDEEAAHFMDKDRKAKFVSEIQQLVYEEYDKFEEEAADYLSRVAADRATNFIERIIKGDEKAAHALFGYDFRYDTVKNEPWAKVIHTSLHITDTMETRRKLVEAFPELLQNEVLKDKDSIIDGLQRQVIKLERDLEETRRRCM